MLERGKTTRMCADVRRKSVPLCSNPKSGQTLKHGYMEWAVMVNVCRSSQAEASVLSFHQICINSFLPKFFPVQMSNSKMQKD